MKTYGGCVCMGLYDSISIKCDVDRCPRNPRRDSDETRVYRYCLNGNAHRRSSRVQIEKYIPHIDDSNFSCCSVFSFVNVCHIFIFARGSALSSSNTRFMCSFVRTLLWMHELLHCVCTRISCAAFCACARIVIDGACVYANENAKVEQVCVAIESMHAYDSHVLVQCGSRRIRDDSKWPLVVAEFSHDKWAIRIDARFSIGPRGWCESSDFADECIVRWKDSNWYT
jgi:hypothetical protein